MRLLVAEDHLSLARSLADGLREEGYAVDLALDGQEAGHLALSNPYDAIILDIMLPKVDGWSVLKTIRRHKPQLPVLCLTARDAIDDRVKGLDLGADDYLTKPFDFRELLARVRALTRRDRRPLAPERIEVRHLAIEVAGQRVWSHGREVALTSREYALLEYMARRAGEVVGRAEIAEHVWDEHYDAFSNIVDVYIQRLRRKLDRAQEPSLIRTRRGQGYQLRPV
jgi:two-component system copper resistance phosphate regulon response regulator CusR